VRKKALDKTIKRESLFQEQGISLEDTTEEAAELDVDAKDAAEVDVDAEEEVQVDSEAGDDGAQLEVEGGACRVGCLDPHIEPLEGRGKLGFPFGSVALLAHGDDLIPGLEVRLDA